MPQWIAWVAAVLCALAIVAGAGWVIFRPPREFSLSNTRLLAVFGFGAGVFTAMVLVDFLPDALAAAHTGIPFAMLGGTVCLWFLTYVIDRRFEQLDTATQTEQVFDDPFAQADSARFLSPASSLVILLSLALHNLIEGGALAADVSAKEAGDWAFVIGMVLHKLPEGALWAVALLTGFPTLLQTRRHLFAMLTVPGVTCILGAVIGVHVLSLMASTLDWVMAVLAGALLYIAFSELLPAMRSFWSKPVVLSFLLGALVISLLTAWID
ncbi:MAG: ZIP family metal transporter [Alicyclobacillus herbarius]|uniref:ZIP family metal transporter n=1 Tax=Alicyclobacillus herbarius TaxID=122960 RepID=UPI00235457D3|nr:ZIP family metal transporter [Alicyclobacillus herbarius]MCL6631449.1 ZIP family metal transporter [Alicyclobacillus herbarius]